MLQTFYSYITHSMKGTIQKSIIETWVSQTKRHFAWHFVGFHIVLVIKHVMYDLIGWYRCVDFAGIEYRKMMWHPKLVASQYRRPSQKQHSHSSLFLPDLKRKFSSAVDIIRYYSSGLWIQRSSPPLAAGASSRLSRQWSDANPL